MSARFLWIIAIALAVFVLGLVTGCANTPVSRSTDTPAFQMREGQTVVVQIKAREEIAAYARKNIDVAYRADAVAFPGSPCVVWMPPGAINMELLNHELAHCAGLTHDRNGKWQ